MSTAFVALGSNKAGELASPIAQLQRACEHLEELAFSRVRRVSSFYRTPAWGNVAGASEDHADYCNAVLELHTELSPAALLQALHDIEDRCGRVRDESNQNAARTLDLDLLLYANLSVRTVDLTVPHPRMHERLFVLLPLLELAPDIQLPKLGKAAELAAALAPENITKLEDNVWDM